VPAPQGSSSSNKPGHGVAVVAALASACSDGGCSKQAVSHNAAPSRMAADSAGLGCSSGPRRSGNPLAASGRRFAALWLRLENGKGGISR
jgi:hypothetical protein